MALRHDKRCLAVLFVGLMFASPVLAQEDIVRVEEDWVLDVNSPDPSVDGPQITCVISPLGHADSLHAIFNLNHRAGDGFAAGGMQLQLWYAEIPFANKIHPNSGILHHSGERVTWTQAMSVDNDGKLKFEVKNGNSQTWGSFGGQGHLSSTLSTTLTNLNAYSPSVSVKNSGVAFAGNRVESLVLQRIRIYLDSGEVQTINLNLSAH